MSRYKIRNSFHDLPFGGCKHNIHGNSSPELLHTFQLEKFSELGRDLKFTLAAKKKISEDFQSIYPVVKCQSDKDVPNMNTFRCGLSSDKYLKGTERFDRIFSQWLALINPHLSQNNSQDKKPGLPNDVTKKSLSSIHKYIQILEETMMVHDFLKHKEYPQNSIYNEELNTLHKRLVLHNELYRDNIVLDKNQLKTTTFHKFLHTSYYIKRHGVFSNFD